MKKRHRCSSQRRCGVLLAAAASLAFASAAVCALLSRVINSESHSSAQVRPHREEEKADARVEEGSNIRHANLHHRRLRSMNDALDGKKVLTMSGASLEDGYILRYRQQHSSNKNEPIPTNPDIATLNLLRRARDTIDPSDVPFLLQTPHSSTSTVHNIMTQCYGLVAKPLRDASDAPEANFVDTYYVNSHEHPVGASEAFGRKFHFISTKHYREGARMLSTKHKGRVIVMMRHPVDVAETAYYNLPTSAKGDIEGLMRHVNSTEYYDNYMVRMLADVPPNERVTEEHFREARMILENKFLVGLARDMNEFVTRRLKSYFGWEELPSKRGCEMEYLEKGAISLSSPLTLEEKGAEWRFIRARNHYDMKLYGRAMVVFGEQKYRMPVHPLAREANFKYARDAVGHLRDIKDEIDKTDLPFFWHIPKASGTTVKEIISNCYKLVRTEMVKPPADLRVNKNRHILNIDLSTPENVEAAKALNVADVGLADVFVSQLALEGSTVFTEKHRGRAFTIMRHPVKLAASLFYYRRIATWEPTYRPEYKDIELYDYVAMNGYYDNWMVRLLTKSKIGGLNDGHLELAKSILKDKFIIGISDHMDETFRHLELYYGWSEEKEGCVRFHLHSAPSNRNKYPETDRGSPTWNLLAEKNMYDMALYYYALELFGDQSEKMFREEKTQG